MTTTLHESVVETTEQTQVVEPGDHERFAHYVKKAGREEGYLLKRQLVALCGKVWVPTRDPERFPICPTCKEIISMFRPGDEE